MVARALMLLVLVLAGFLGQAQQLRPNDTLNVQRDSLNAPRVTNTDAIPLVRTGPVRLYPRRAALLSAVLPGAGQIYNRKYWKLPILYGGVAALVYFYNFNDSEFKRFRKAYVLRYQGDNSAASLANEYPDIEQLSVGRDFYRRNRDLTVILGAVLYAANIVDALVDAHLSEFNVTDDLTASVKPSVQMPSAMVPGAPGVNIGMTLTLKLK